MAVTFKRLHCTVVAYGSKNTYWHPTRPAYLYCRMFVQLRIADSDGQCWATAFQEQAEILLGHSAEELAYLKDVCSVAIAVQSRIRPGF